MAQCRRPPCRAAEGGEVRQWAVSYALPTAYCLLPTAYCLLPTAYGYHRTQTPPFHILHRRIARRVRRTVVLRTHTPARRWKPTPQAWRTCVTRLSGTCSGGGAGMACAELARVSVKASATILIIVSSIRRTDGRPRSSDATAGTSLIQVNALLW